MENPEDLKQLYLKLLDGTLTEAELARLEDYFQTGDPETLYMLVRQELALSDEQTLRATPAEQTLLSTVFQNILMQTGQGEHKKSIRHLWPRIAAAASILVILSVGGYYLLHKNKPQQQLAQNLPIVPGSKKALLILSNGKQISLTDTHSGTIAQQSSAVITKTENGQIVYKDEGAVNSDAIIYNTIVTPRGGYYPLQMADGTVAILDAGSSIKYPVNFRNGQDRLVEITGQVYFEVEHNAQQPFCIRVKGQTIEDIGTKFNINAYDDEPVIRTSLVEGSIKIANQEQSVVLKPGEQAVTKEADSKISIRIAGIDDVVAWKNGQTSFEGESVQEIMRQVSRWYDVDVVYDGTQRQRHFTGGIARKASFAELLKVLSYNNIRVTAEGKKLIVKP